MITENTRVGIEGLGRNIPGLIEKNTVDGKLQEELFWASFSGAADAIISDVAAADRDSAIQAIRNHLLACDLDPMKYGGAR